MFENINLEIAGYKVLPVPTGEFALDGGAMFGTVPKVLWEKSNPPDDKNRIPMEARALLLKSKDRIILIDCGNGGDFIEKYGPKLGPKFKEMYGVNSEGPSLLMSLEKHQITPEMVTDVVLTHLHFDHAGGSTCFKNGTVQATFPNAKYYVQKSNLETAQNPNIREKASYFAVNYEPLIASGQLQLLNGNEENFIPGLSLVISNGHTQGHQGVRVSDSRQSLFYCGDIIPTSSHVRLAWVMGYDLNPLMIIEEKKKLLFEAAAKKSYLFFEHDPYCDIACVAADGADFKVEKRFNLTSAV